MYVVGTAGHVDHGKSTLINALTGIDPDRLPQEKERGMTIDLGFAWLDLPSGQEISIVDVPGHERFVRNMLAGVGSIDLALLTIAADEGVMPQTLEHLAILDLLQIKRGLVAITKTDLVDSEFLEFVRTETEEVLRHTVFEGAPMISVSSLTRSGLDDLLQEMDHLLKTTEPRQDLGRPRLAVDRSFTISGFGTVVTGTLIDGTFAVGQEVELVPSGRICRIRGLESHRKKIQMADPGRRLAVNLSGVSYDEVRRSEIITTPHWLKSTTIVDAKIKLLKSASRPMKHNSRVTFHSLVSETPARIRLLDTRELQPGHEAWAQIHLGKPLSLVKDDFFVIRSTETTLGGGRIVDAFPRRHRPFICSVLKSLEALEYGSTEDLILESLDQRGPCDLGTLARRSNLSDSTVETIVQKLSETKKIVLMGGQFVRPESVIYSIGLWNKLKEKVGSVLNDYFGHHPLRKGIPREELRNRLDLSTSIFSLVLDHLVSESILLDEGSVVTSPEHKPTLNTSQQQQVDAYLKSLDENPFAPPTNNPIKADLLELLVAQGKVVKIDGSIIFSTKAFELMVANVRQHIEKNGNITVATARTLLNSSRKYVLPFLEYLDQQRITRRIGDEHILR